MLYLSIVSKYIKLVFETLKKIMLIACMLDIL